MAKVQLSGGFYQDSALQFDAQRSVNMYPVVSESDGGKGNVKLKGVPGLIEFANGQLLGDDNEVNSMHVTADGRLFASIKLTVPVIVPLYVFEIWEFDSEGTGTRLSSESHTGPFGDINMSDNGIVLSIVTGTDYAYFITLATNTINRITDPDWPALVIDVTFKDTYFVWIDAATDRFYISSSYASDFTDCIDALEFGTVESNPDKLVSVIPVGNEIAIFGEKTIEFFYNNANIDFPFARNNGAIIEIGTLSARSLSKINNAVYFLGSNESGYGIIYRMEGYNPIRISTHAIEAKIRESTSFEGLIAYTYQDEGNYFYVITMPGLNTTFCYDEISKLWHERAGLDDNGEYKPHPGTYQAFAFNKNIIAVPGVTANGLRFFNMSYYDNNTYTNSGDVIPRERTFQHIYSENNEIIYSKFQIDLQKGVGLVSGAGNDVDPVVEFSMSRDGGMTLGTPVPLKFGKLGDYSIRAQKRRLGIARDAVFRLYSTSAVQQEWFNAFIEYQVTND